MIPNSDAMEIDEENVEDMEEETIPTRTFYLNEETKSIEGMVDGIEALKQAVMKIILTESEEFPIYSAGYGVTLNAYIGQDIFYAQAMIKDSIEKAILSDDRFESVEFTNETIKRKQLIFDILVTTVAGETIEISEVSIDV